MDIERVRRFVGEHPDELLPPRLTAGNTGELELRDVFQVGAGAGLAVVSARDGLLVVPVAGDPSGDLRRAVAGDGVWAGVLGAIGDGATGGRFTVRRDAEVPRQTAERAIDVDQSNDSVVVAGSAVVKLYVRTSPGPQPGLDLPAHLAAVGFAETPASFGALVWRDDDEGREVLVASAAAYLPGARDGWDWYPELVLAALDGEGSWEPAVDAAARIGGLVGRLHRALATPSGVLEAPVGEADAAVWAAPAEATLEEALGLTDGEEGERLRALAPRAGEVIARLREAGATPVMRIHGDLHVGQILRWDGGEAVADLDGNPLAPAEARVARDSPARDVAAMARAIDHVGRVAQRRRSGRDDDVRAWIRDARDTFLDAYRDATDPALFDERLLAPFEVAQEAHEYVYVARYLPHWRYVPDRAMPDLLETIS